MNLKIGQVKCVVSRTLPERGWSRRLPWLLRGGPGGGPMEGGRPSSPRHSGRGGRPSVGGGSVLPSHLTAGGRRWSGCVGC